MKRLFSIIATIAALTVFLPVTLAQSTPSSELLLLPLNHPMAKVLGAQTSCGKYFTTAQFGSRNVETPGPTFIGFTYTDANGKPLTTMVRSSMLQVEIDNGKKQPTAELMLVQRKILDEVVIRISQTDYAAASCLPKPQKPGAQSKKCTGSCT